MIQILGQLIFLFMITLPLSVTFFYAVFAGKMGYKIKPEFIKRQSCLPPFSVIEWHYYKKGGAIK